MRWIQGWGEKSNEEMSTDISNNDFVKQKRNQPLQDEMPEDERMDDKDSQNEYSETSEQLMNEGDYFEWDKARLVEISIDTSEDSEYQKNPKKLIKDQKWPNYLGHKTPLCFKEM